MPRAKHRKTKHRTPKATQLAVERLFNQDRTFTAFEVMKLVPGGCGEPCRRIGVPAKELPHLKTGIRKQQRHYSEYFDAESMRIVAARHQNDIRLFGYKFERP